jgi:DNA-directed RNA polymerase specialized sigma24 family protein
VPLDTVAEFEVLPPARRLEQLLADQMIVERLREVDFDDRHPLWRELAEALAEYGLAVLVAWGVTGCLLGHVARHGGVSASKAPRSLRLNQDDAEALATEILMKALPNFRSKSLKVWRPTGGASLKTFFIGRCLMEFTGVYGPWYRREKRPHPVAPVIDDGRQGSRPDLQAEARVLTDQILDRDPVLPRFLELQAEGYELSEIAEQEGTTTDAVRSKLHRSRKKVKSAFCEEEASDD